MAKIAKHTGESFTEAEQQDEAFAILRNRPTLGGSEAKSPGSSSSQSVSKGQKKSSGGNQQTQQPAQTTENPSEQDQTEDSTAHTMGGSGQKGKARKSAKPRARQVSDEDPDLDFDEDE